MDTYIHPQKTLHSFREHLGWKEKRDAKMPHMSLPESIHTMWRLRMNKDPRSRMKDPRPRIAKSPRKGPGQRSRHGRCGRASQPQGGPFIPNTLGGGGKWGRGTAQRQNGVEPVMSKRLHGGQRNTNARLEGRVLIKWEILGCKLETLSFCVVLCEWRGGDRWDTNNSSLRAI